MLRTALADNHLVISESLPSDSLSQQHYRVWLPESYKSEGNTRYPLLLVLDGQKYGNLVASNAKFLAYSEDIPEHIIVTLDVKNRLLNYTPTDSSDWDGDGGAPKFLTFITDELLPELEKKFRFSETRIMWGHSAAGLFAMYAFMNAPHGFNAFLVNDGSLDWDNRYIYKSLSLYLQKFPKRNRFLYLNTSFLDPDAPDEFKFIEPIVNLLEARAIPQLRWVYQPMPDESHASIPLLGSIHGLKALYKGFRIPESIILKGLPAVKSYFESVKGQIGARKKIPESVLLMTGIIGIQHNKKEAIEAFRFCIELYPESLDAREQLAEAYLMNEQTKLAIMALEEAILVANELKSERTEGIKQRLKLLRKKLND